MDSGRKNLGDKMGDKFTPDSSKSTLDKTKDSLTGAGDKVARDVVPDSQKSTGQSTMDKMSRQKDANKNESILDKAKGALGMDKH
ncbi:hypothetical protein LTR09_003091 [Extremus antarcticus]|uniref:Uncharacterized protein n=1 Tax=Extremus antarcticus TaxID=702011 RepID=A0AAJ0LUG3_9PEZI|nr:hypothetical protein LTR09_003091 [Extremus antarcticus]